MNKIEFGNCLEIMQRWIDEGVKVNTCVTSPPYYGLRDYGTATWIGGDKDCNHWRDSHTSERTTTGQKNSVKHGGIADSIYKSVCKKCGAIRQDQQLGLEETPQQYVESMVRVFRLVKQLLTDDGTLWVNIGDSYAMSSMRGKNSEFKSIDQSKQGIAHLDRSIPDNMKAKDLMGIPWMLAFALREDGWYLRQDIIWHKPNPMPESVKDRCTKSHEYIFLLSKSPKYYFDNEAIKEPCINSAEEQIAKRNKKQHRENASKEEAKYVQHNFSKIEKIYEKRNKRDVWSVNVKPYKGAHFATYPVELIEPCIKAGCPDGGIVLDPFMGSGTTAQVAIANNKQYLGCELNTEYKYLQDQRIGMI